MYLHTVIRTFFYMLRLLLIQWSLFFYLRCVVFVKIFVKIFNVGIILDTIFFVFVFISVVFGNVVVIDDDNDISFVVGVVFNVAELMISVVEDVVDVFDADICFVFETSI